MDIVLFEKLPDEYILSDSIENFVWFYPNKRIFRRVDVRKFPNKAWRKLWYLYLERKEYNLKDIWLKEISYCYGMPYYLFSANLKCFFRKIFSEETNIPKLKENIEKELIYVHKDVFERTNRNRRLGS